MVIARSYALEEDWVRQTLAQLVKALKDRKEEGRREIAIASEQDMEVIFCDLRDRYLEGRVETLAIVAITIVVMKTLGIRPIEFINGRVLDKVAIIRNAKRQEDAPKFRGIDMTSFNPCVRQGVWLAFKFINASSYHEHKRNLKRVSEALARVCSSKGMPRFSVYSFRHLAVAIWVDSGVMEKAVSVMLGHRSRITAQRNYARSTNGGWKPISEELPSPIVPNEVPRLDPIERQLGNEVSPEPDVAFGEDSEVSAQARLRPPIRLQYNNEDFERDSGLEESGEPIVDDDVQMPAPPGPSM